MPVRCGKDSEGCYCRWGDQKKYRYACGNDDAKARAFAKAAAQGKAIRSSGYKDGLSLPKRDIEDLLKEGYLKKEDLRGEDKTLVKDWV